MTSLSERLRRLRPFPLVALPLVWVLLWGTWSLGNALNGLLLTVFLLMLLPLPSVALGGRLHPAAAARFAGRFVADLLRSSAQVAWQAIRPAPQDVSSVVAVQLRSCSELLITMTAEALSLVPGSIIVEVDADNRTLYAHVLSAPDDAAVTAFRRRVLDVEAGLIRAVGHSADLALLPSSERAGQL